MISGLYLKNFQGQTGRYSFIDGVNLIDGKNGVGKSTIIKATQLLILGYVPGDDVNKDVNSQYNWYCSNSGGEMIIEVITSESSIVRTWSKSRSKVSAKTEINGAKVLEKQRTELLKTINIFDVASFWRLTPSEQINVFCALAGVDPDELSRLDEEIERANTNKRNLEDKVKQARQALKDHEIEIQSLVEDSRKDTGVNIADAEAKIRDIDSQIDILTDRIEHMTEQSSRHKSNQDRKLAIQNRMSEVLEELENLHVPSENISTDELEQRRAELDGLRISFLNVKNHNKRLNEIKSCPLPVPTAYQVTDIQDLRNKILDAENGRGVSEEDRLGYDIGKKIFQAIKNLEPLLHEGERTQCQDVVREICGGYKERVVAAENASPLEKVYEWRRQVQDMESLEQAYKDDQYRFTMGQKEARQIEKELEKLGEIEFNQAEYNQVVNDLAARKQALSDINIKKNRQRKLIEESEKLAKEMSHISISLEESEGSFDIDGSRTYRTNLKTESHQLREQMRGAIEYKKLDEIRERKIEDIDSVSQEVAISKRIESDLIAQKTELLDSVQSSLSERCQLITSPCRVSMELPATTKKTDRIKFFLHQQNGDKTERATLCGAEKIEFDLGLAYALVGNSGIICSEIAELTADRCNLLVNKLNGINSGPQALLAGHTLERFCDNKTVNYILVT